MTCWAKCKHCGHRAQDHGPGPNGDRCQTCNSHGDACSVFDMRPEDVLAGVESGEIPAGTTSAGAVSYVRRVFEWDRKEVKP